MHCKLGLGTNFCGQNMETVSLDEDDDESDSLDEFECQFRCIPSWFWFVSNAARLQESEKKVSTVFILHLTLVICTN